MSDVGKTLRQFSPAGPCLTVIEGCGPIIRETAHFWIVKRPGAKEQRVSKHGHRAHTEPCRSCTDHPSTSYPHGYMD